MQDRFLTIIKTGAGVGVFSIHSGANSFGSGQVIMRPLLAFAIGLGVIFSAVNVEAWQATPEVTTIYTITSSQNVNARSCPRLTCSIVTTLAPGQEFSVAGVVSGDAVSGSDQWYKASINDAQAYIHSSLAEPQPNANPTPEATGEANAWHEYTDTSFTMSAPPGWIELADDPQFISQALDAAAESNPQLAEVIDAYRSQLDSGLVDMLLLDPVTASNVVVAHMDTGFRVPLSFLEKTISGQLETAGGKVLETEYVQISAGETLRFHVQSQLKNGPAFEQYDYVLATDTGVYFIAVTADRALFEQIVNSFTIAASP